PTSGSVQSYSWVFEEGTPDSSAVAQPGGSIAFPNTGTFSVSLTAVDTNGVNDASPPTRRITVQSGPTPTPTPTPTPSVPQNGAPLPLVFPNRGKDLGIRAFHL